MDGTLQERATTAVARGVALLDQCGPAGWRDQIDLPTFSITSDWDCVLGQVYGLYSVGATELFGEWIEVDNVVAAEHGFFVRSTVFGGTFWQCRDALQAAWLAELSQ